MSFVYCRVCLSLVRQVLFSLVHDRCSHLFSRYVLFYSVRPFAISFVIYVVISFGRDVRDSVLR